VFLANDTSLSGASPSQRLVVGALGFTQILGYGTTFYLLAILSLPISSDTGWSLPWVIGGLSIGMLCGGLASPLVGRAIERHGGRPVLAAGSVLLALGLVGVGSATNLSLYLLAWCVIGLGMGSSLYEAAFAALGRLYGRGARSSIITITLYGGFASTICWPLSALLNEAVGWRWTCLIYAAVHVLAAVPVYLIFPKTAAGRTAAEPASIVPPRASAPDAPWGRITLLALLAMHLTLTAIVATVVSVHLLVILEGRGYSATAAVMLGALLGPSQVAGRAIELVIGRSFHPFWTAVASSSLIVTSVAALAFDLPLVALVIVVYGAGVGVSYIVRGTLPLALFGPIGYATLMGKLALPSLVAQALAPWAAALTFTRTGLDASLIGLFLVALVNLGLLGLIAAVRRKAAWPEV
jgi:predicted MFS family arabinose efflux permease